ncbi:hypothetical protein M9Y10_008956 [Tritrichomonas musculus]|uniref:Uncharacterized protein n=1 Tax=Tritrichomonas musculus TaxID=1915356 RepID=A0ABR2J0N9_9EUKA
MGAHRRNIKTLINYLNRHNAQEIINPNFNDSYEFGVSLVNFIVHEQNRHQYEENYLDYLNNESINEDKLNETYTQYHNKQHELNKSYEQNYDENITNRESFYDDELDEQNIQYFERQAEIENAIKRANEAVDNAIRLIKESKPNLKKVEPKLIKDKSHFLEYYIPENEELFEYLDKAK